MQQLLTVREFASLMSKSDLRQNSPVSYCQCSNPPVGIGIPIHYCSADNIQRRKIIARSVEFSYETGGRLNRTRPEVER